VVNIEIEIGWLLLAFVLLTLGALAVQAVRSRRMRELMERRVAELNALSEVGRAIVAAQLDVEEILERILEGVQYLISFDAAAIFDVNDDDTFTLRAARGAPAAVAAVGTSWSMSDGGCLQRLTGLDQPLIFGPGDDLDAYHQVLGFPSGHSCLALPIRTREKLIGVLALDHRQPGQYGSQDAALAAALSSQAASALENARLYALQQEEVWISTALLEVAEATSLAESLDEVIDTVVRITPMLVGVDRCTILLWSAEEAGYEVAAAYELGDTPGPLQAGYVFSPGEWPLLDELWETGAPVVDEFGGLPGAPATQDVETTLLALPLRSQGEMTGAMVIGFTGSVSFNEQRIKLIAGIANQTALAIESAELVVAQQEEAWVSLALLQVAEAVANLAELDDVLGVVSRLTPLLVGVEGCLIYLWDAEQQVFRPGAAYGIANERVYRFQSTAIPAHAWPELFEVPAGDEGAGVSADEAVEAGRSDPAPPDPDSTRWWEPAGPTVLVSGPPAHLQDALDLKAPLALPLQVWGELMGAIVVDVGDPERILSSRRLNILSGVAQQTATAIQNSRLHIESLERQKLEQELRLARQIQASFLPAEVPQITGWDLAAYWQGARQVSGDFYDFVQLSDQHCRHGQWGFVVADVADKGMPAALFMALSRTLVRTMAMGGSGPAEVLEKANDMIMADSRSDLFVTLFYAILDAQQGVLSYASAGHNPPLHFHARSGGISNLSAEGIAMGVIRNIELEQCQRVVEPGDVVLLYTDGVTDALNETMEEFGLTRLHRVLEEHNGGSAAHVIRAINQAVEAFVGDTPQFDDFTLVALKRELIPGDVAPE
jgi:sigma-B regulation protein RsbU (phosphoserine phosphatase)